jgi:S1-C subfamily serine protease
VIASILAILLGALAALTLAPQRADTPATIDIPTAPQASAQSTLGRFNPELIYQARATGVVTLDAVFGAEAVGGSGFVIDGDGYILTSAHVVYDFKHGGVPANDVYVEFAGHDRVSADIIGYDQFNDVAVLKVDPSEVALHPVPLGNSDKIIVGQPIAAIGSPFGNEGSLSLGVVSAAHRSIPGVISAYDIADMIQTDAAINHGNSGGPIFDERGRVVCISQQIRTTDGQGGGVSFCVPINTAKRSFEQVKKTGTVKYAHLGLTTKTVSPQLAKTYKLPAAHGVLVQSLKPGGPSDKAGLHTGSKKTVFAGEEFILGDEIVAIGGQPIVAEEDVARVVSRIDVGESVQIDYFRDGKRMSALAVAGERVL